jgi:hypothetical protein
MVRGSVVHKPPVVLVGIVLQAIRGIWTVICGVMGQHAFRAAMALFDAVRAAVWHDDISPTA